MTYYKGLIIDNRLLKSYDNNKYIGYSGYPHEYDDIYLFNSLKECNQKLLKELIKNGISRTNTIVDIQDNDLIKFFDVCLKDENQEIVKQINNISNHIGGTIPIVYELVKDKEGNLFGKELYTKNLFPIYNSKCEKFNYYITTDNDDSIVDKHKFKVLSIPNIDVSSMLKCENFIVGHKVANKNDYDNYINKFKEDGLFKKRNEAKEIERYKKIIIKYANSNVFKEDFCLEEETKKEEIKDVVLKKISETNLKLEKSILEDDKKLELKKLLLELANYYVNTLKNISISNKKAVTLDTNQKSIIGLRSEIMKKLFEIEMQLPPEDINVLVDELKILEKEIIR